MLFVSGRLGLKMRWRSSMGWGCMADIPARMARSWECLAGGTWAKRRSSCILAAVLILKFDR